MVAPLVTDPRRANSDFVKSVFMQHKQSSYTLKDDLRVSSREELNIYSWIVRRVIHKVVLFFGNPGLPLKKLAQIDHFSMWLNNKANKCTIQTE